MMKKGLTELPVDEVILDLEDSVAPNNKKKAQEDIIEVLCEVRPPKDKTIAVRINGIRSKYWREDLMKVIRGAGKYIDCIMIPKIDEPEDVRTVERIVMDLEEELRLKKRIGIEAQIETARGLAFAREIAFSSERLESLVFGPGDYAASLGMRIMTIGAQSPDYPGHLWHYPMFQVRNSSAAAGLQAIDGPYAVIPDSQGFEKSAKVAKSLGYDGKWVIHPSQIEICNRVFTPTHEEIARAKLIVEEYHKSWEEGKGAVSIEGEMVDTATLKIAARILDIAKRLGLA